MIKLLGNTKGLLLSEYAIQHMSKPYIMSSRVNVHGVY